MTGASVIAWGVKHWKWLLPLVLAAVIWLLWTLLRQRTQERDQAVAVTDSLEDTAAIERETSASLAETAKQLTEELAESDVRLDAIDDEERADHDAIDAAADADDTGAALLAEHDREHGHT